MKRICLNSPILWKDSITIGLAILATLETVLAISSLSLDWIWDGFNWLVKLLFVLGFFMLIVLIIFIAKYYRAKKGISIKVRGINVNIRQGDIFEAEGWRVIAFNEFFDTTVDDIIIAHNTVNGIFIDYHVEDLEDLKDTITNTVDIPTLKRNSRKGRLSYPLGRIITYKEKYMLLAFAHFDNNMAHLTQKDYENCLRVMWTEISRTYANKPIHIPLLGSGITRFDGTPHKSKSDLLRCMLCTLRTSGAHINQPITILLTEEAMQEINIYEMKGAK